MYGFTQLDQLYGAASVIGATGVSAFRQGRITATARSVPGVYSVTLDAIASAIMNAQIYGGTPGANIQVVQTAPTNIAVTTFDGLGVPTDFNWSLEVRKVDA